jgi:putative Mg2+ transporter-C (MgtC) family protein
MEDLFQTVLDWQRIFPQAVKMGLAFLLALPIAFNRERATRIMGLRTFPLVAVASCGYMLIGIAMIGDDASSKARVVQGLITGMGFIGGGAILKKDSGVKGTATAASLWSTGAVGAAVAFNFLDIAIVISVLTFIVLRVFTSVKQEIDEKGEAIP